MSDVVVETNRKRATKAAQRARAVGGNHNPFIDVDARELRRLLKAWGWEQVPGGAGSHEKWRWHSDQVNFPPAADGIPRVVVYRAAASMGVTAVEFLTGPTIDNPGVAKAAARADELAAGRRVGLASTADRLTTGPVDVGTVRERMGVPAVSVAPEGEGIEGVTDRQLEWFLSVQGHFTELDVQARRAFLEIKRRAVASGLMDADEIVTPPLPPATADPQRKPVPEPTRAEKALASRKASLAARYAAAKPPGEARSISEVLERTPGPISSPRRQVLEALVAANGFIDDGSGRATAMLVEAAKRQGHPGGTISGLLRSMESDGQIARDGPAKRTYRVRIVDPIGGLPVPPPYGSDPVEPDEPVGVLDRLEAAQKRLEKSPTPPPAPDAAAAEEVPAPVEVPSAPEVIEVDEPAPVAEPPQRRVFRSNTPDPGTLLEVKFTDRSGRIFLEAEDGSVAIADGLRWV